MQSFELEMELFPASGNAPEIVKAAAALAQTAADLLEETVPDGTAQYSPETMTPSAADLPGEAEAGDTAEYAPEASARGSAESEGQDISPYGAATVADDVPQPASIETAMVCSEVPATQPPEPEGGCCSAAALQARRSARGARGHYMGETVGAYVGHNLGARRIKAHSNHHDLDGVHFQIRTINGSQNTATGAKSDPDKIIVAAKKRGSDLQGSSRYVLYGVLRADALMVAKKSRSRGHVNSGHYLVSLSQVQRVELGSMIIPDEFVVADSSEQRTERLDRISTLEPDLNDPTIRAARAFLAASSHTEPDALDDASIAIEATSGVCANAPGEAI